MFAFFNPLLDPFLSPLLRLPPFWSLVVIVLFVTLGVTLVQKYKTDQRRLRELKALQKRHQQRIREAARDPEKLVKLQQEQMAYTLEMFRHSFKPLLYTLLPLLIVFGWMQSHLAFQPIMPGEEFSVSVELAEGASGQVSLSVVPEGLSIIGNASQPAAPLLSWRLRGGAGWYTLRFSLDGESVEKEVLVGRGGALSASESYEGLFHRVTVGYEPIRPLGSFSLFGWRPGWFGTYVLLSFLFSILFRKLFHVV